jgi:hypothetical protein
MNAQVQAVDSRQTGTSALDATHKLIKELEQKLVQPTTHLAKARAIVDAANVAHDAAKAAANVVRAIEVRRLLGELVDVAELQRAETAHADAERGAAVAERKADPARSAVAQLEAEIAQVRSLIAAEANRVPELVWHTLREDGDAGHAEFREAIESFAAAWMKMLKPYYSADLIALKYDNLHLPVSMNDMLARFTVPMPDIATLPRNGYIELSQGIINQQARALLATFGVSV